MLFALATAVAARPRLARAEGARAGAPAASGAAREESGGTVVVTGTRTPERAQRATVRTDVVTREEAERRGATNVAEALGTQPGLQVNPGAYGFLGGVSALQIQGFDRDRVLVLEDGERVVGDVGGAVDLATLPVADLARLEIVTGPTSSLYGSSAIGGVVNLVTAAPAAEGASGRARLEGRERLGYVLQGNAAYRRGDHWAGLDVSAVRQGSVRKAEELPDLRIPTSERKMLGLRAGTRLSERVDLRIRARLFHDRVDGLETQTAPGLGRYVVDLPERTRRVTLHVIETVKLGRESALRLTVGRQWTDTTSAKDLRGSPLDESRDRAHGMQSLEAVLTLADGPRTWVVGGRAEAERFHQEVTKTASTAEGPRTTRDVEVAPQELGVGALYGQLQWRFGPLVVLPGVRAEAHTRYGAALAPRLAAALRLGERVVLRASVGRGFRAPSAKELGYLFDHSFYGYRIVGAPELRPETSLGGNADVSFTPEPRLTLRASGFANWIDDLIDVDPARGVLVGSVTEYRYVNYGAARTFGAQLDATARLAGGVRADVSYAYLFTRDDVNDRPLGGRPPHVVTASLAAALPLGIEAYGRLRANTSAFVDRDLRSPPYATVDLRLARALWPEAQAYVGVLNLTGVHAEPGRLGDQRPPLGRVVYVGLRAAFPWEDSP